MDSIGTGKTDGVFQLESAGMKNFMKELKPQSWKISLPVAVPAGADGFHPQYIKGKNDKGSITYDCPQLEPILAPTYGCIVYQEQVMQIVRSCRIHLDEVTFAKAMSKGGCHGEERQSFVYGNIDEGVPGCLNNGIDEKTANKIYDEMIDLQNMRSINHAAAYAVVSYQTAYLKYAIPLSLWQR
ncbi:MAG: hypothetical protein ACLSXO_03730 [Coprococcus sp.]